MNPTTGVAATTASVRAAAASGARPPAARCTGRARLRRRIPTARWRMHALKSVACMHGVVIRVAWIHGLPAAKIQQPVKDFVGKHLAVP